MEKQSIMSCICIVLSLLSALQGVYPQRAFIVAQDGSGNFTTLSQAISAAPNYSSLITYIKLRAGIYHENVFIPKEKINLHLLGDGMDKTKISGNRSTNMGFSTFETATVRIVADGFVAKEITFENTAGVNMNQSVAVTNEGRYSAFYICRILSCQDTLYVWKNIKFFRKCDIYGTVDFIFGDARALFQNCNFYARRPRKGQSNTITAQERKSDRYLSGTVMQNCWIVAARDLQPRFHVRTYLGRPRQNYSTTVIMQSFMDKLIDPRGWWEWPGHELDTLFNAEYQNRGPGANTKNRVKWARTINYPEAKRFTARVFLKGEKWISSTGYLVTFENTAGVNMNQLVAVTNEGQYSAFYRCRFLSYQDTLYVRKNIRFFRVCDIYGTVDFILGDARALFQNCNVYACRSRKGQSNTIKAQERKSDQYLSGIVMQNCTIVAAPDLGPRFNARTYLGRPRQNYSTTVIMQSFMDKLIDPRRWWEWPGHELDTLFNAEYQNQGPGANTKNRVKWACTINYPEAKRFTARVFLKGEKWISSTGIPCYLDL